MLLPEIQKNGYNALLAAARILYPDCDYIIDIMIDHKKTLVFFMFPKFNYVMRGTAIQYIYRNVNGEIISRPNQTQNSSLTNVINTVSEIVVNNTPEQERIIRPDISITEFYTVRDVVGQVRAYIRFPNGSQHWNFIYKYDVLNKDTLVKTNRGASLILSDGINTITIPERNIDTIEVLVRRYW